MLAILGLESWASAQGDGYTPAPWQLPPNRQRKVEAGEVSQPPIVGPQRQRPAARIARAPVHRTAYEADAPASGANPAPEANPAPVAEPGPIDDRGPGCMGEACDAPCGGGCDDGGCDPCFTCRPERLWVQTDYLMWWTKGYSVPPLVTTSSSTTAIANAGVLGQGTTAILFGDQALADRMRSGGRLDFGLFLDACNESAVEGIWLAPGRQVTHFDATSDGSTVLARPFYNIRPTVANPVDSNQNPRQDAQLIAYPNFAKGSVGVAASSELQGAEVLWRRAWYQECDNRLDLLVGYRFARLDEDLQIFDSLTGLANHPSPGTFFAVSDVFDTQNEFHGAEIGMNGKWRMSRWTFDLLTKVALGSTRSRVMINGATSITTSGTGSTTTVYSGGLLAQSSNIGVYTNNDLTIIPELGLTVGYDLTCHLRATFGYTFLYWSKLARPGDQIDFALNPNLFPPATGSGQTPPRPAFVYHDTDFWAQGMNFGLEYRF